VTIHSEQSLRSALNRTLVENDLKPAIPSGNSAIENASAQYNIDIQLPKASPPEEQARQVQAVDEWRNAHFQGVSAEELFELGVRVWVVMSNPIKIEGAKLNWSAA
jgi:hypothetical protein